MNSSVIKYQCSRKELIVISWKRTMLSPRTILALTIWALIGAGCLLYLPDNIRGLGLAPLVLALIAPLNVYQLYAKSVDSDPANTEPKTLEFKPTLIVITGSNWKSEFQWSRFKKFSEDKNYFLLFVTIGGHPLLIPKRAFTNEQLADFRKCVEVINPLTVKFA
jgi:uncharacterized membrane protein YfcA